MILNSCIANKSIFYCRIFINKHAIVKLHRMEKLYSLPKIYKILDIRPLRNVICLRGYVWDGNV